VILLLAITGTGNATPVQWSAVGSNENRIIFGHDWNLDGKEWNDLTGADDWKQSGYVVEYEAISSVPEPATMKLFVIGIIGLCCIRTKRNTEKSFHKG